MGQTEERSRVDQFGLCEENIIMEKGSLSVKIQRTFLLQRIRECCRKVGKENESCRIKTVVAK